MEKKASAEKAVREIRRKTRRRFSAEEKIRIVVEGLRGEESIASLCRREGIVSNLYYRWSKEFLEAGKKRRLVESLRRLEQSLGDGEKGIAACEQWEAAYSRRSIIVMKDAAPGEVLSEEHLALLQPGSGLHPRNWDAVIGRRTRVAIEAREPLRWEMLEGDPSSGAR